MSKISFRDLPTEFLLTNIQWSIENAPEERLRVGLPRWESEEHRVAYNDQNPKGDSNQRDQDIVDERSSTQQRRHARGSDHKKSRNRR